MVNILTKENLCHGKDGNAVMHKSTLMFSIKWLAHQMNLMVGNVDFFKKESLMRMFLLFFPQDLNVNNYGVTLHDISDNVSVIETKDIIPSDQLNSIQEEKLINSGISTS